MMSCGQDSTVSLVSDIYVLYVRSPTNVWIGTPLQTRDIFSMFFLNYIFNFEITKWKGHHILVIESSFKNLPGSYLLSNLVLYLISYRIVQRKGVCSDVILPPRVVDKGAKKFFPIFAFISTYLDSSCHSKNNDSHHSIIFF